MNRSSPENNKGILKDQIDLSFVVIGYNEGKRLQSCFNSIRNAALNGINCEIIYVDAGSIDESLTLAKTYHIDQILGGDKRRLAAENRNLGWRAAKGGFVHFLDGDMMLDKDWPVKAMRFLSDHPKVGVVCGNIEELRRDVFYQTLELDWKHIEGKIRYCGGAALWRKEILSQLNGFPEDVSSGEEPWLCYRVRNELGLSIYQLNHRMVTHDLGFLNWIDIWRRHVRCGRGLAEISTCLFHSHERLWLKETINAVLWSCFIISLCILMLIGSVIVKAICFLILFCVILRKTIQLILKGHTFKISSMYALYVYLSKIPLGFGAMAWHFNRIIQMIVSQKRVLFGKLFRGNIS